MEQIRAYKEDRKAVIVLNQPQKRNALSPRMIEELTQAFNEFREAGDVKVIVLRAEGTAFCAGADLSSLREMQSYGYEQNLADSSALGDLFYLIYTCPKPVIAEVQGPAIAGGCGLVTVCDFVFAVPDARFGYTEVRIGFIPAIVMSFLVRRIGEGHARRLLLSGELTDAAQAWQLGLITRVVEPELLAPAVEDFARHLIKDNSGEAMKMTKQMLTDIQPMTLTEALSHGVEMNARARSTVDCRRGIDAFLRKQNLEW